MALIHGGLGGINLQR